ncbi:MAG: hypothetical protein ACOYW3_16420 [Bacteroidota bacterium]
MKTLKTADFIGQSLIIVTYVLGTSWAVLVEKRWSVVGATTAIAMLWLGWWQMVSALIMLVLKAPDRNLRLLHFSVAFIYLSFLLLFNTYSTGVRNDVSTSTYFTGILVVFAVAIPVALAILYYALTWRLKFPKRATGSFLPHTSF